MEITGKMGMAVLGGELTGSVTFWSHGAGRENGNGCIWGEFGCHRTFLIPKGAPTCEAQHISHPRELDGTCSGAGCAKVPSSGASAAPVPGTTSECSHPAASEAPRQPRPSRLPLGSTGGEGPSWSSGRAWGAPEQSAAPSLQCCSSSGTGSS